MNAITPAVCSVTAGQLRPCPDLDDAIEEPGPGVRGLVGRSVFVSRAPRAVLSHIVSVSGMHLSAGLLVRYCPFCGTGIGEHVDGE